MKLVVRLIEPEGYRHRLIWSSKPCTGGVRGGRVEVKSGGSIAIPASLLRRIGIKPGGRVLVYSNGENLVIERPDKAAGISKDALTEIAQPPPFED